MRRTLRVPILPALLALTLASSVAPGVAQAKPVPGAPVHYTAQDPSRLWANNCRTDTGPFAAQTRGGVPVSQVLYGEHGGAAWHIEVPVSGWNGNLVLWAHGYNGTGTLLCAGVPNLSRQWYIDHGYAWAASSYATNGYDVAQGVKDTHELIGLFSSRVARPQRVYLTGESMGGHVTAVSLEQYPKAYDGAMPTCGVLGGHDLFSYFLDANVTAAALAGKPSTPFPVTAEDYAAFVRSELPALGNPPAFASAAGQRWRAALATISGGIRPGVRAAGTAAPDATSFWNAFGFGDPPLGSVPFLFGVYPGVTGGTIGVAQGNVADNTGRTYQLDADPAVSPAEQALNAAVTRVAADPNVRGRGLSGIPDVDGNPSVPVVSLHGLGDLFVPFRMEQDYARAAAPHGKGDLFVSRAIRETQHCGFTQPELVQAFTDLVRWVEHGVPAQGDPVTDTAAVAATDFGCRWTSPRNGAHLWFDTPCPAG